MKKKDICCQHYEDEGLYADLGDDVLWLCNKCDMKLRKIMLEQIKIEDRIKKEIEKKFK